MKLTGISSMGISSQRYFTLISALHKLLHLQLIAPFLDTVGLLHFVMRLEDEVQLCEPALRIALSLLHGAQVKLVSLRTT